MANVTAICRYLADVRKVYLAGGGVRITRMLDDKDARDRTFVHGIMQNHPENDFTDVRLLDLVSLVVREHPMNARGKQQGSKPSLPPTVVRCTCSKPPIQDTKKNRLLLRLT